MDFVFDTVASAETLQTGLRIVKARTRDPEAGRETAGAIVVTGVSSPKRFEWTPWYFKEVRVIGSNAFAVEEFEGRREHSYGHYFRFLQERRVDPTPMLTHRFPLEQYREALVCARDQKGRRAIKVLFTYESRKGDPAE